MYLISQIKMSLLINNTTVFNKSPQNTSDKKELKIPLIRKRTQDTTNQKHISKPKYHQMRRHESTDMQTIF